MTASALQIALPDADATVAFGRLLGSALDAGGVLYLYGELGAGKTTLVRGLLRARGYDGAVKSPTYTLIEPYRLGGLSIVHCDLYRLADAGELEFLGLADLLDEPHLLLVEWPERAAGALPAPDWTVRLSYPDGPGRRLSFRPHGAAAAAVGEALRGSLVPDNGLYTLA